MSTERPRRLAVVVARYDATDAAPPGIDPSAFARACLADTYEVLADLVEVDATIAGPPETADLLWPGAELLQAGAGLLDLARLVTPSYDEVVLVPADVPDLPGLVLAKIFKVLHRVDAAVAPVRGGPGGVALGLRLPLADWLPAGLDLDLDLTSTLEVAAPRRGAFATTPDWHRLRGPAAVHRLDPGLEGWDETRALLGGHALGRG